jgi:hypothetical protein
MPACAHGLAAFGHHLLGATEVSCFSAAKAVRLWHRLSLDRLDSAFVFIVKMHREDLPDAFAFCLHSSLKQCLLNFRRKSAPTSYNSLSQSPIHLLGYCCVRFAVVKMFVR